MRARLTKPIATTDDPSSPPQFEEHLRQTLQDIRGALTQLLASLGADPTRPQELARQFNLNKNLTWKVAKIVNATEVISIAQHLPGRPGIDILLRSFKKAGASGVEMERVRRAVGAFDSMVEIHCGDRTTLDLMLSSMVDDDAELRETSRKLAFQGNSATFGVQARVRVSSHFIAPSANAESMLDLVSVGGMLGFRRLRPTASWPLFRSRICNDDGSLVTAADINQPLDSSIAGEDVPFVPEFCSSPLPEIRAVRQADGVQYALGEGPVGNTAALSYLLGFMSRGVLSCYRDESNSFGGHPVRLTAPTEALLFDLFVHEQLPFDMPPEIQIYSRINGGDEYPLPDEDRRNLLPILERVQQLGNGLSVVATPLFPRYPELFRTVFDRMAWDRSRFKGYRFVMRYPPIPSVAVLRYELPARPS